MLTIAVPHVGLVSYLLSDNVQYKASGMPELMPASECTYSPLGFRIFLLGIAPGGGNKEEASFLVIAEFVVTAQEVGHRVWSENE